MRTDRLPGTSDPFISTLRHLANLLNRRRREPGTICITLGEERAPSAPHSAGGNSATWDDGMIVSISTTRFLGSLTLSGVLTGRYCG